MTDEAPRNAREWLPVAGEVIRELSGALSVATDLVAQLDGRHEHAAEVQRFRDLLEKTRQIVDRGNLPEGYGASTPP